MDSMAIDREEGPSWARANWPVATLDAVNLGLDPTEATLEQVGKTATEMAAATGADPDAIRRAADGTLFVATGNGGIVYRVRPGASASETRAAHGIGVGAGRGRRCGGGFANLLKRRLGRVEPEIHRIKRRHRPVRPRPARSFFAIDRHRVHRAVLSA